MPRGLPGLASECGTSPRLHRRWGSSSHSPPRHRQCARSGCAPVVLAGGGWADCSSGRLGGSPRLCADHHPRHSGHQSPIALQIYRYCQLFTLLYADVRLPCWIGISSSQFVSTAPRAMNWIQCLTSVTRAYTPWLGHSLPKLTTPTWESLDTSCLKIQ